MTEGSEDKIKINLSDEDMEQYGRIDLQTAQVEQVAKRGLAMQEKSKQAVGRMQKKLG